VPALSNTSADALAGSLRGTLIRLLPNPLYEASPGWGQTKLVARGLKWKAKGGSIQAEIQRSHKNDGTWRKVRVTAFNPADTLVFDLRNLQQPEPGRMTFDAFVAFDARLDAEQQNWESGVRLYSGSVRARFRVKLALKCEFIARLESNGTFLPDAVLRLRVLQADLHYENLVVEHIAGVGGEAAQLIGDAIKTGLHQWHPSLERDLLVRANEAIVKAGDTKEVRLSLAKLFARGAPASK
jgi:hypothetical protein